MADDDGPNNLIHFPRVGFTDPAEPSAETPDPAPADVPFAAPATVSTDNSEAFAPATRAAPLDTIVALPEPGLGTPFRGDSAPAAAPAAGGAMVPATFRSEGAQPAAPRLGALSLAAILAVSLAAMRGIHSAIATGRANREQREAVAKTASTAKDGPLGGSSKKQLQPSHEYGRKTLQRGPGGPGGRSGGAGPGRSGGGGSGSFSGSGGRGRSGATTRSPSGSGGSRGGRGGGSGSGSGGGRSNSNSGSGKGGSGITPLRRSSQGGGSGLKKNRGPGSSGGSGGSGGGKGPSNSGGGGGGRKRSPGSGSGGGSSGPSTNRKRGPGGSSGGPVPKRGPGSGTGTGKTGPSSKSPGKGTGTGKTGPGASGSKGPGSGKGTGTGPKSGTAKSPRGTTGPGGILRKKPGTTTPGTGPKSKSKGKGTTGPGGAAPGKGGGTKGKARSGKRGTGPAPGVPRSPGGKSRKGKKVKLTPGIAHGTMAASDTYGCRCRKCRRFDREYGKKMDAARKAAARGRTTFGEAVHETAEKRLKRRRKKMGPPVLSKVKVKKPKKKTGPKTKTKAGTAKPAGSTGPTGPAAKAPARRTPWSTAKARARKRARMRTTTVPAPSPAPTTAPATPPGLPPKPTGAPTAPTTAPAPAAAVAGATTAPARPGGGTVPGTGQPRLSPFEAMGMATTVSAPAGPITVERADSPGSAPATSGAGLPAGTSTKENSVSDAWLTKWGSGGIADMDAQHQTEVTLDDTLNVLEELTEQSFKAHETCRKLSVKAREIRYELDELAADLRSTHNVIGRLTGAAMAKLAESMELLARKADEMATKSLVAAELSETAENAMFDAYRPLQQATEDAGLAVPAARVHNEN
ncbi:hypothetical protein [Streptomyces sp900129855]|uniref:Translation initiation factor IF-2 n=1 Tax=Streptomyces sp. 900129855 TaxID=3155129 RepID=A0ABV2ZY93_9ACTN